MPSLEKEIFANLIGTLFDVPIMGNLYRPHYVERMIAIALGESFVLMSADWAGWDIEHRDGVRIEVKQSAALQTWTNRPSHAGRPYSGSFDIEPRKGYWADGNKWVNEPGRQAHIYIFAWHSITDPAIADHRDASQWRFFVVLERDLPQGQKTISRTVVEKKWPSVTFDKLCNAVNGQINSLTRIGSSPQDQCVPRKG